VFNGEENLLMKIEPWLREDIEVDSAHIKFIPANKLLTWNRFDLAFKLAYLEMRNIDPNYGKSLYERHLKSFGLGSIREPGNQNKSSLKEFIDEFENILNRMQALGFDKSISLIPLSSDGGIANGAHRLACAIYLNKEVACLDTKSKMPIYDYKFFRDRNISQEVLDLMACKFIEKSSNTYIAFLWPAINGREDLAEELIPNIVYKKRIQISLNGAHNLLSQIYYQEEWIGEFGKGYPGIKGKLNECFRYKKPLTVIAFQADDLDEVRSIKDQVRAKFNIGKHSIHITDSIDESLFLSNIIFNENSIHFLNYGDPTKYPSNKKNIELIKSAFEASNLSWKSLAVDGGFVLSLYGIRESNDIDYISTGDSILGNEMYNFSNHQDQLTYHKISKEQLINNPHFYFVFERIKFIAIKQIYLMKKNRNESKDRLDCKRIDALINEDYLASNFLKLTQLFLYARIKIFHFTYRALKKLRLVNPLKKLLKR
jgi:hypothetical protein